MSEFDDLVSNELDSLHLKLSYDSSIFLTDRKGVLVGGRGKNIDLISSLRALMSSFLEFGAIASNELSIGHCLHVAVESEHGRILMLEVEHSYFPMTLMVVASPDCNAGKVLYFTQRCAENIRSFV